MPCIARGADAAQARQIQGPQRIRYTDWQLHRLKVLACAAAGLLTDPECVWVHASREIDDELQRLADLSAASERRGDDNFVHKRGALLESDVAMSNAPAIRAMDLRGAAGSESVRIHVVDGQQTDIGLGDIHWDIGRLLLDGIPTGRPDGQPLVLRHGGVDAARQPLPGLASRACARPVPQRRSAVVPEREPSRSLRRTVHAVMAPLRRGANGPRS